MTKEVMRAPDLSGPVNKAWRLKIPPVGARKTPDEDATLEEWLVHCPGAHMCWSYWWIGLVHLRPIEGSSRAPSLHFPTARYEILCFAQDPDHEPNPDDPESIRMLRPIDWVVQFGEISSDANAKKILKQCIMHIANGYSPDTDFGSMWKQFIRTNAHHLATIS